MNETILIVDDEPEINLVLGGILKGGGYQVISASGGMEAIEIFKTEPIGLVITDIRMPGMDGLEVIRRVKELDPDMEAIALTGYATLENAIATLRDRGAFDYLTKPLENLDELFMTVEKAFEKRRLTLENRMLLQKLMEKEGELILQNQALQKSERKHRELTDSLPVNLFETDEKGTVTFMNPFALESLQYTPEDLAKGLHIKDILDERLWEMAQKDVRKKITEKSSETKESEAERKDGTTFPVLVNIQPVLEENRVSAMRGFAVDITERQQRLEEMNRMAKLESLGTLAGGIAHDFNNLLSIILGNIEIVGLEMSPETLSAKALKIAEEGCLSAKELAGQFITFSKGGAPDMKAAAMDVLLRNTVQFSLSGANVNCEYDISEVLDHAKLDERQMEQVIQNLIQNAIEAMPEGGTVQVRAENVRVTGEEKAPVPGIPEGRYIKVEIQDEGTGISEEHMAKVFDPYFTSKSRGVQKGIGLGLSTALSIVKKHGGFIFLASEAASGTTVSIYLPAILQDEKEAESGPAAPDEKDDAPPKGLKVLMMDDDEKLRDLAGHMLELFGYEVETVSEGREAVEAYRKSLEASEPFDVVLLDLTVKGGPGGREAIRELLKLDPDVKAVVLSGYADDPVMSNCEEYGFRTALSKPFLKTSLEDALRKAMDPE